MHFGDLNVVHVKGKKSKIDSKQIILHACAFTTEQKYETHI